MDLSSLVANITNAVIQIDSGRKGFAIKDKADEGRISYENGISRAMSNFQEVQITADPRALIIAEYAFISQEFELCDKSDKDTIASLAKAIEDFKDALLAIKAVENVSFYKGVDNVFPHNSKYREKGYPKDSLHIACNSNKVRIKNTLRATGIDPIEKSLLRQRFENMTTAKNAYIEKQKLAFNS